MNERCAGDPRGVSGGAAANGRPAEGVYSITFRGGDAH